jgi:ureidoacrylate peracid hydrolase
MQNDFGAKGGMFDRAGLDISGIQKAIPPTARVVTAARRAGLKVVYLKMAFRHDLSDLGTYDAPNRTRHMFLGVGKGRAWPKWRAQPDFNSRYLEHRYRARA